MGTKGEIERGKNQRMDGEWASYSAISSNLSGLKFASDSRSSLCFEAARHTTCRESAKWPRTSIRR